MLPNSCSFVLETRGYSAWGRGRGYARDPPPQRKEPSKNKQRKRTGGPFWWRRARAKDSNPTLSEEREGYMLCLLQDLLVAQQGRLSPLSLVFVYSPSIVLHEEKRGREAEGLYDSYTRPSPFVFLFV